MNNTHKAYLRNIYLDFIHVFIRNLNVTHGIWMAYLYIEKGFTLWELGVFEGIFHFASITMEVPTGVFGDLVGRKLSRVFGLLSMIIYIALVLLGSEFWIIALGFFVCGLGYTFESGSGEALVYDSLIELNKEDTFMKVQGIKEILFQVSSSIALFIGGYLALVRYEINYYVMFIVFVTALIPILLMKEIRHINVEKPIKFKNRMYEHFIISSQIVFNNKKLRNLILISALLLAPVTTMFFFQQNYLIGLKYDISFVGLVLGFHSIAGAVGGYVAHKLERKFKETLIIYIVPIFLVISFWIVLIDSIVYIPFVILGFLDSIFYVVISDYINRQIPSAQRATILSFTNLAFSIVMIILFPIIGFIAEFSTLRNSFIVLAAIVSISYISLLSTVDFQD